jgi:hypothetical protein
MSNDAGKYADLCAEVLRQAEAKGAIVIVLGGKLGSGFSIEADFETLCQLPDMLETIAKQMRQSTH